MARKSASSGRKKTQPTGKPGRTTTRRRDGTGEGVKSEETGSRVSRAASPAAPSGDGKLTIPEAASPRAGSGTPSPDPIVREAHRDDIPELEQFVERFVQANRLLPRTTDELYDLVPFGFVAYADGRLVGFAALEIYSAKLAEVRSLAVHEDYQGRGIGKHLVQKCVELAHTRNILEVMAITSADGFFKACGFDFTLPGEKKALFMQTRDEY